MSRDQYDNDYHNYYHNHLGALLSFLDGFLDTDNLAILKGDQGLHLIM